MKKICKVAVLITAMVAAPVFTVHADEGTTWFGDSADGRWLAGIKYGQASLDSQDFESADAYTLVLGYQFARPVGVDGTSNFEFEYTNTDTASRNTGLPNDTWEMESYGLYLTYQSPGTVYFKGRLGVLWTDITEESNGVRTDKLDDAGFAYGVGLGVRLGEQQNVNLEIDYTAATGDNDISLVNIGGYITF